MSNFEFYTTPSIYRRAETNQTCPICSKNLSNVETGLAILPLFGNVYTWVCSEECSIMYIFSEL